jgi:hypothetical protein
VSDGTSELSVSIQAWGPGASDADRAARAATRTREVRRAIGRARHRRLSTELVAADIDGRRAAAAPRRVRTTIYDYDGERALRVEAPLSDPARATVAVVAAQPPPGGEEFAAAVAVIGDDPELGGALAAGRLEPYRPMPPLVPGERPDGEAERVIAVGLRATGAGARHEIVGVALGRGAVVRFERGAPDAAAAGPTTCGPPEAGQPTVAMGTPGSARITVKAGPTVLWRLVAVRPAASSGIVGSGVELKAVDYRGKRVLRRAHVPILNVEYKSGPCGPYRDWQWEEGRFQAPGTTVAPGFRLCTAPPTTLMESGVDAGNFAGVAVYVDGDEVVLVSEMEAGWYRYISQWRLHRDGTIRPRFGFAGIDNSCICDLHHHHAYWRLNFDIGAQSRNSVQEWNDHPGPSPGKWRTMRFEARRPRATHMNRKWRVVNTQTRSGYEIVPGHHDGQADAFGVGDFWAVRLRKGQIDDGQGFTSDPVLAPARIDTFVNGDDITDRDVVVWYVGHFKHDVHGDGHPHAGPPHDQPAHGHIVGPELRPHRW